MKLYTVYDNKLFVGEGNDPEECIKILEDKIREESSENIHSINHRYDRMMKKIIIIFDTITSKIDESVDSIKYVDDWKECSIIEEDSIKNYFGDMSRFAINLAYDYEAFLCKRKDTGDWVKVYDTKLATTFPDRESAKACFEEIKKQGIDDMLRVVEFQYKAY